MTFPSPVGGLTQESEFIPSIVFAIAYVVLLLFHVPRSWQNRKQETFRVVGTAGFTLERVVLFSLRAAVALRPGTESNGLTVYMQTTIGMGFITISWDVCGLLACALVSSTCGGGRSPSPTTSTGSQDTIMAPRLAKQKTAPYATKTPKQQIGAKIDDPEQRRRFNRISNAMFMLFLASIVTGCVGNCRLVLQRENPTRNRENQVLRFASTALVAVLIIWNTAATIYWRHRVNTTGRRCLLLFCGLLGTTTFYRLSVMHYQTPSLDALVPGSQNLSVEKGMFYLFHILPEWLVSFIVLTGVDLQRTFDAETFTYG